MVINHKYFKHQSLVKLSSPLLFIAATSVFIAAKVLYMPVTLEKAVQALFSIEKRRNPTSMMKATLSKDRENHYRDQLEKIEFEILFSIGFDFELELPYKHLRTFCEKHVPFASRESLH
jgi:hypothetical protein